jgi:hypothetical protein
MGAVQLPICLEDPLDRAHPGVVRDDGRSVNRDGQGSVGSSVAHEANDVVEAIRQRGRANLYPVATNRRSREARRVLWRPGEVDANNGGRSWSHDGCRFRSRTSYFRARVTIGNARARAFAASRMADSSE